MNRFKEIKKGHPLFQICPVCGHEGWCATIEDGDNLFLICKRDVSKTDVNGFSYLCDTKKEGNSYFIFGEKKFYKNNSSRPISPLPKKKNKKNQIERFSDSRLDKIYRDMFSLLILEENHRKYLKGEGFTDEMLENLHIKSWPVTDYVRWKEKVQTRSPKRSEIGRRLFEKHGDLTGLPGAYLAFNKKTNEYYWTFAGKDGIMFGLPNVYGEIVMCQLRLDKPDKGGKYRILSSTGQYYENGCSPGSRISVVKPKHLGDTVSIYLTEGYKKAAVAADRLGGIVITIQGVNSWAELFEINERNERLVDVLKNRYKTQIIIVALDNDKYENMKVMDSQKAIIKALKKENFEIAVAEWDSYMGRGLDDVLNNRYRPFYVLV